MFDSPWHWLVVAIVAFVLFFGWKQLPEMSRSLGRSLRILKTELKGMSEDDKAREDSTARQDASAQPKALPAAQVMPIAAKPVPAPAAPAQPAARPRPRPAPARSAAGTGND